MTCRMSGCLYDLKVSNLIVLNNCSLDLMSLPRPILLLKFCYPMLWPWIILGYHTRFGPKNFGGMTEQGYRELFAYLIATALVIRMRMRKKMLVNGYFLKGFLYSGIRAPYSGVYQYTFDNIAVNTVSWHQRNLNHLGSNVT